MRSCVEEGEEDELPNMGCESKSSVAWRRSIGGVANPEEAALEVPGGKMRISTLAYR